MQTKNLNFVYTTKTANPLFTAFGMCDVLAKREVTFYY